MDTEHTSTAYEQDNEPIELGEVSERLAKRGIKVSKPTIYRWAQEGPVPNDGCRRT